MRAHSIRSGFLHQSGRATNDTFHWRTQLDHLHQPKKASILQISRKRLTGRLVCRPTSKYLLILTSWTRSATLSSKDLKVSLQMATRSCNTKRNVSNSLQSISTIKHMAVHKQIMQMWPLTTLGAPKKVIWILMVRLTRSSRFRPFLSLKLGIVVTHVCTNRFVQGKKWSKRCTVAVGLASVKSKNKKRPRLSIPNRCMAKKLHLRSNRPLSNSLGHDRRQKDEKRNRLSRTKQFWPRNSS